MLIIENIKSLLNVNFLNSYLYVSKQQFLEFIKYHVKNEINKFDTNQEMKELESIERENFSGIENRVIDILINAEERKVKIQEYELSEEYINNLIEKLVYEKIIIDSIDYIILLEEIDYMRPEAREEILNKLVLAYYYLLEVSLYQYFDIMKLEWNSEKQKEFVRKSVEHSTTKQLKIKEQMIEELLKGKLDEKDEMLLIGVLSTYPLKKLQSKYDSKTMEKIYKTKYFLTLDSKLEKCSENKLLEIKNKDNTVNYKSFIKEAMDKYKKMIEANQKKIVELQKENELKDKKILNYTDYISEYNSMSVFKKLAYVFRKEKIKLLN